MRPVRGTGFFILAGFLVASGASALVYQALWVKQVGILVGVDVYAVTAVVSAFFAGLALGNAILGQRVDESHRPLIFYARLELGIGASGLATTLLLSRLAAPYAALEDTVGRLAWMVPILVIAVPAFLMGGTLPALMRVARPRNGSIGSASGALYAANTAGGVVGVLAGALLLVPALGVRGAGACAAATNLILAALAWWLAPPVPSPTGQAARVGHERAEDTAAASRLAVVLYAVAGGLALGFEVVWSQAVVQFINTRTYAFALVLATYLTGLVLGSALWARLADRVRNPWQAFGLLEAGAGTAALLCFVLLTSRLPLLQGQAAAAALALGPDAALYAQTAMAPVALLFVPTVLFGAAFPVVGRLACGANRIGRDIGAVTALNLLGGILGTLLTGFIAVPVLGLCRSLALLAIGVTLVGAVAILRGVEGGETKTRRGALAGVAAGVIAVSIGGAFLPEDHLARLLVAGRRGGTLESYQESAGGTVAVVKEPLSVSHFHRLYISGISNSADHMMSRRYMRLQALLPLLVQKSEPRSALVIGLGTGITCGATLAWPLERRVCAELLPAVVRAVDRFDGNLGVATDPRVNIRIIDGRHLLLRETAAWDLITLEPPPPAVAGAVNLYSRDFYEIARARLTPDGIVAQWYPLHPLNADADRALVRSFIDVFPYATMWTSETHEMLLLGSMQPFELDVEKIATRFEQAEVKRVLAEVGVRSPEALLATYVTDRAGLEKFAGDTLPVTDDRPRLEYERFLHGDELTRKVQELFALQREPPLARADPVFRSEMLAARQRLHLFYRIILLQGTGRVAELAPLLQRVLREEGDNPYYRFTKELGL